MMEVGWWYRSMKSPVKFYYKVLEKNKDFQVEWWKILHFHAQILQGQTTQPPGKPTHLYFPGKYIQCCLTRADIILFITVAKED